MRGGLSCGRRPPVNRPAGPARPPVVPAAVRTRGPATRPAAAPPPARPCPEGRTHSGHHPQEYYPLRRRLWGTARGTGCASGPRARWHPASDWDNDNRPGTGLSPVTPHRRPMPPPAFRRGRRPPRPLAAQLLPAGGVPPPRARPRPEPAGRAAAHPAPGPAVPRRLASRAPRGPVLRAPRQALSAPLSATARAGPWPLPNRPRPSAGLAGQPLDGTGYGPDLCPYPATGRNQLPGMSYVPNRLLRTNTSLP